MQKDQKPATPAQAKSPSHSQPFTIGSYSLFSLNVQEFFLDGGAMFGVVPKPLWEKVVPADTLNRIKLVARLLLISGNGRNILVDTGMGTAWSEKLQSIFSLSPFKLHEELRRLGLTTHDITDVIFTHLHYDHVAGMFELQGDHLRSLFPEATLYVQADNYQAACHPHPKEKAGYVPLFIEALGQQKNLRLLNGETELFEGISLLTVHGHTPGQQLVKVFDNHRTLVHCADLFPFAAHIPISWIMSYDIEPLKVFDEKTYILDRALKESWILYFGHDPMHEAATVRQDQKGIVPDRFVAL
ncbi:MAG: MBL fold metallo-hydrolase [Chlorobium sp.]|nr:MAG: MBL fold metallo-hydrolase [Chlorobium sp.]